MVCYVILLKPFGIPQCGGRAATALLSAATSAAAPACGSRGRSPSRRSRQGLVPRAFGEEPVELGEVAVDEGLLEADGEELALRLLTGFA